MNDIFKKSVGLLQKLGVNKKVEEKKGFLLIKSIFKDPWYNFIVPTVPFKNFDLFEAEKVVADEAKGGFKFSYYIQKEQKAEFDSALTSVGYESDGSDVYMVISREEKFSLDDSNFEPVIKQNFKNYLSLAKESFPGWPNNKEYAIFFYELEQKGAENFVRSVLLKNENKYISFGVVSGSKSDNLAYLHNMGTAKAFRRQGYFTLFTKHLMNLAIDEGITNIYALVESGSGSYFGFKKLGFERYDTYVLYNK